jgi:hypothetical protein
MAGPARFAWFIMAELLALVPFIPVQAASPRDAVKLMPVLTHTSDFQYLDSEGQNKYYDTWDVYWNPPPIQLSNYASGFMALEYHVVLSDLLNRADGSSSGSRWDHLNFRLGADAQQSLSARYTLDTQDTFSAGSPPWVHQRGENTSLKWTPGGMPQIMPWVTVSYSHGDSFSPPGAPSDSQTLSTSVDYTQPVGAFAQHYGVHTESTRTLNYGGGTPTNTRKLVMDGYRDLPMGALGHLLLNYRYDEKTDDQAGLNTARSYDYNLNWSGNVSNVPLSYSYNYNDYNYATGTTTTSGNTRQERRLDLTFRPPTPPGKGASVVVTDLLTQTSNNPGLLPADLSVDEQMVNWIYQANPRVGGWLIYDAKSTTDMAAHLRKEDSHSMTGYLAYQIPGNRGNYAVYLQQTSSRGQEGGPATGETAALTSTLNLGRRAYVSLNLNQGSGDNRSNPLDPWTSNAFSSQVNFHLWPGEGSWDQGLSLDAWWRQSYNRTSHLSSPAATEEAKQTYNITLNYVTPANWQYTFTLGATDTSNTSSGIVSYSTINDIDVKIIYSF